MNKFLSHIESFSFSDIADKICNSFVDDSSSFSPYLTGLIRLLEAKVKLLPENYCVSFMHESSAWYFNSLSNFGQFIRY